MCDLCSKAAKLIRVPWLGNMKDENAISCAHNLHLVTTKPCTSTLHFPYQPAGVHNCSLHSTKELRQNHLYQGQCPSLYAIEPTTKRAEPEPCIAQLADRCSTQPLTGSQSFPYGTIGKLRIQTAVPKCTQSCSQKRSCTSKLLAYILNSIWLTTSVCIHPQAIRP